MINAGNIFDDLEGPSVWEDEPSANIKRFDEPTEMAASPLYKERCNKCGGSGRWGTYRVGQCFACKGKGYKEFKTDPAQRSKARASAYRAKAVKAQSVAEQALHWIEANPELAAWMNAKRDRFDFAASMYEALHKYGGFSEKQLAAIQRLALADKEREAARKIEAENALKAAPAIQGVDAIEHAFGAARDAGIKKPKLRLAGFKFSPAPAHGKNAGAIYVVEHSSDQYLGKIVGGKFVKAFSCQPVMAERVLEVAANPKEAAIAYGKQYGSCACCGRELSNPESVALGIGPICAGRFGW